MLTLTTSQPDVRRHSERRVNDNDLDQNKLYKKFKHLQKINLMEKEMKLVKEYQVNNNGWNQNLEGYIQRLGERSGGYRWMHNKSASFFSWWYRALGITGIILGVASGTFNIPSLASGCTSSTVVLLYLSTVFMYLIGVVLGIQQFLDLGGRKSDHTTAEANYSALYHNIRTQLSINRIERQVGKDYLEWISKEAGE